MSKKFSNGLEVKPSYEDLMNIIIEGNIIKPKKPINILNADFLANTFEISELRKMAFADLERLDENIRKQELMKEEARKISKETGVPAHAVNNELRNQQTKANVINFDLHDGDIFEDAYDEAIDAAMEIEKEEEEKKRNKVKKSIEKVKKSLDEGIPKTIAQKIAAGKYNPSTEGQISSFGKSFLKQKQKEKIKDKINEAPTKAPDVVEEEPKTKIEKQEEKKLIKEMLKETPTETKPKRKKQSVKATKEKTIKETRTKLVKNFRPEKEPKKEKKLTKEEKIALDENFNELKEKKAKQKEQDKLLRTFKGVVRKANKRVEDDTIKTIIDKLPDEYDKKRRKVEKKKADKSMEKTRQEIKELEAKQEANDEYRKLKAEVKKQKQLEKLEKQQSKPASSSSGSVMVGNVKADNNTNKQHWEDMSIEKLREQAMIRGITFTAGTKKKTFIKIFHDLIDNNKLMI